MWTYFGSKANIVDLYPRPVYDTIIEPFAGTARYALKYFEKEVILIDRYPLLINIWKWLQECSSDDILKLPRKILPGTKLKDIAFDCDQARDLYGFLIGKGESHPRRTASKWVTVDRPNLINYSLNRIAANLYKIKHWVILLGSYDMAPDHDCTWFIDPPYQYAGHEYAHSRKKIDYNDLSRWCLSRKGQVIVCENDKAKWLPFVPFVTQKTIRINDQRESIFTAMNGTTEPWRPIQQKLF